jgi:hypothetical protein
MNNVFIFELENVLVDGLNPMPPTSRKNFRQFVMENPLTFILTDYDYRTLIELLGHDICKSIGCICSNGRNVFITGREVSHSKWEVTDLHSSYLHDQLSTVQYSLRHGRHLQKREGCGIFCIPGFEASPAEKERFLGIDRRLKIRGTLCDSFNTRFPLARARLAEDGNILITAAEVDLSPYMKTITALNRPIHYFTRTRSPVKKHFVNAFEKVATPSTSLTFHEVAEPQQTFRKLKAYQQTERVFNAV